MMHFPKVICMMPIGSMLKMLKFEGRFNILTFVECIQFAQKALSLENILSTKSFFTISTKPITLIITSIILIFS